MNTEEILIIRKARASIRLAEKSLQKAIKIISGHLPKEQGREPKLRSKSQQRVPSPTQT